MLLSSDYTAQYFIAIFLYRTGDQFFVNRTGDRRGQSRGARGGQQQRRRGSSRDDQGFRGRGRGSADGFRGGRGRGSSDGFRGRGWQRGGRDGGRGRGGGARGRGLDFKRSASRDVMASHDKKPRLAIKEASLADVPKSKPVDNKPLHPSWVAKQQQKKATILPFQGKKVVFGDDD